MGHADGGQASDQANLVGQAGAGDHSGQVVSKARHRRPDLPRATLSHRHRAWWFSIQEHRNDTHRSTRPCSSRAAASSALTCTASSGRAERSAGPVDRTGGADHPGSPG